MTDAERWELEALRLEAEVRNTRDLVMLMASVISYAGHCFTIDTDMTLEQARDIAARGLEILCVEHAQIKRLRDWTPRRIGR